MKGIPRRVRSSERFKDGRLRLRSIQVRAMRLLQPKAWTDANPFGLIWIHPEDITRILSLPAASKGGSLVLTAGRKVWLDGEHFHKWRNVGRVAGGDGDLHWRPFGEDLHHRLMNDRFIEGVP
jgi:hypothetical protein